MGKIFKSYVHYISTKFPSVFLKYLRAKLQTSELEKASIYKIAKVAYNTKNLDDLYQAIHKNRSVMLPTATVTVSLWRGRQQKVKRADCWTMDVKEQRNLQKVTKTGLTPLQ